MKYNKELRILRQKSQINDGDKEIAIKNLHLRELNMVVGSVFCQQIAVLASWNKVTVLVQKQIAWSMCKMICCYYCWWTADIINMYKCY